MDREEYLAFEKKIIAGLDIAFKKMLAFKKEKNSLVVIERDGKVVRVKPEELE